MPNDSVRKAAERLHHLSMRYSGALVELVEGRPVGLLPADHPGLHEVRDFIDLILLTRAEINGLTAILLRHGIKIQEIEAQFEQEYRWFTDQTAKSLNVEVTDHGLMFKQKKEDQ